MKPAPFEYHSPATADEAVSLKAEYEGAEFMAGNQSLAVQMSNRLATPNHLIDLNEIQDLAYIDERDDEMEIGAMTRHATIKSSDVLDRRLPLIPESAGKIAGPSVRNMGTLGGSLAEADPAGNYPTVMTALDATLTLLSPDGRRDVDVQNFYLGYMFTDLQEDELIESVTISTEPFPIGRTGTGFHELKRVSHTWPKLSSAAVVRVDDPTVDEPVVEEARLAFANADDTPLRVEAAEEAVEGTSLTEDALEEATAEAIDAAEPSSELQAEADYKEEQVGVYGRRALQTAYDRALEQ